MAERLSDTLIWMKPEDFEIGSGISAVLIDGERWVSYGDRRASLKVVGELVDKLNMGEGVPDEFQGSQFAVAPNYTYDPLNEEIRRITNPDIAYRIWIKALPMEVKSV